jgi:hypothetical protein
LRQGNTAQRADRGGRDDRECLEHFSPCLTGIRPGSGIAPMSGSKTVTLAWPFHLWNALKWWPPSRLRRLRGPGGCLHIGGRIARAGPTGLLQRLLALPAVRPGRRAKRAQRAPASQGGAHFCGGPGRFTWGALGKVGARCRGRWRSSGMSSTRDKAEGGLAAAPGARQTSRVAQCPLTDTDSCL